MSESGSKPGQISQSQVQELTNGLFEADLAQDAPENPFVWPPTAQDTQDTPASGTSTILERRPLTPNALIESIEVELLGRTGLAFDVWAKRIGWKPNTLEDYCWRCSSSIGPHESTGDGCSECQSKKLPWERSIRLGKYAGTLKQEIQTLKFHAWKPTGKGLGHYLGEAIAEQMDRLAIEPEQVCLIPVPMHRIRRARRGVDHTAIIANSAAQTIGCRTERLLNVRYRREQVGLSMTARAQNAKQAYFVSGSQKKRIIKLLSREPRLVVVIDDVRTTGATLVSACKAIKTAFKTNDKLIESPKAPPEIWVASVCVAGESGRKTIQAQEADK